MKSGKYLLFVRCFYRARLPSSAQLMNIHLEFIHICIFVVRSKRDINQPFSNNTLM